MRNVTRAVKLGLRSSDLHILRTVLKNKRTKTKERGHYMAVTDIIYISDGGNEYFIVYTMINGIIIDGNDNSAACNCQYSTKMMFPL